VFSAVARLERGERAHRREAICQFARTASAGPPLESVRYDLRMETDDLKHLERCVELAYQALEAGDEPFGSVLVDSVGRVCFEDHNRVASGDRTRHPEFALARWAAANMSPVERAASTVYTSGEHCPMCAAAHGWVGLGRIVYASSSAQLATWLDELGVPPPPVATLPIKEVVPGATVEGPVDELATRLRDLHFRFHMGNGSAVAPGSNA